MKYFLFLLLIFINVYIFPEKNILITSYDTTFYPVNDNISFYFSFLEDGEVISNLDDYKISLSEHDPLRNISYKIDDFTISDTDQKQKRLNFTFLIDNSLSMYFYTGLDVISKDNFEKMILPFLENDDLEYINSRYSLNNNNYFLNGSYNQIVKNKIASIINENTEMRVFTRIDKVKTALKSFIKTMPYNKDNKSLSSFNLDYSEISDFTIYNNEIISSLDYIMRPEDEKGWTELYEALNLSFQSLNKKGGRKFLILLSDGYQYSQNDVNNDGLIYKEIIDTAVNKNITVFTIGLGEAVDHIFLSELASKTGGIYINSDDDENLLNAYQTIQNILNNENKITYKAKNMSTDKREIHLTLDYTGKIHKVSKEITTTSILGNMSIFSIYWLLLLLIPGVFLIFILYLIFKDRHIDKDQFLSIDGNKRFLLDDQDLSTKLFKNQNQTKIINKNDENYIETSGTVMINNQEFTGTRILHEGDIIKDDDGTRMVFIKKKR